MRKLRGLLWSLRVHLKSPRLPEAAKAERRKDASGLPAQDPGIDRVLSAGADWLCRAQDMTASHDDGVARHFSLITGWSATYPETTGYIVPTMIELAQELKRPELRERARRMLDWLVSIQFPEGGFQGGMVTAKPVVPVTFNTGQILIGLAAGVAALGDAYREPMCRAADWLVATQDDDGAWRRHSSPFTVGGAKAYESHVAWGMFEAARLEPGKPYGERGLANVRWALRSQRANGWFENCCITQSHSPITHTIGYMFRAILEAYRFSKEDAFLVAAEKLGTPLLMVQAADGSLPGRLNANWQPEVRWVCLTGVSQIAHGWLLLHQYTGNSNYLKAAQAANRYVRRTVDVDGPPDTRGGVKGAFPVNSEYGRYDYLNWACKFTLDANLLEKRLTATHTTQSGSAG